MIRTNFSIDADRLERRRVLARALFKEAAREAVRSATRTAEKRLEDATAGAGLGILARAWASKVYPSGGGLSYAPAGYIYPKGAERTEGAIRAFANGATIRHRAGQRLAIPLPPFRKQLQRLTTGFQSYRAYARLQGGFGRFSAVTPALFERETRQLLFPLRRRGKPDLLGYREGRGRNARFVPVFVLLPKVRLAQRFSIPEIVAPAALDLKPRFLRRLDRLEI